MPKMQFPDIGGYIKKEAGEVRSSVVDVMSDAKESWKQQSARTFGQKLNNPPIIEPGKLKRIIVTIIKVLIFLELLGAIFEGMHSSNWSRLGIDLLLAGILYIMWDRITRITQGKKEAVRRKVEMSGERIKLWDALVFSLLWTDEIYADIPADRRRLVVISYTLIALGILAAHVSIGEGFMPFIISSALVLGAVNLLNWIVSRERGERETLATELQLAHDVQVSLMPKEHPRVDGFDIAGISIPAKEVGGDHFDYSRCGDESQFCISVFDVSGKGMEAAMSAVFTSGAFASEAQRGGTPGETLTRLNKPVFTHTKRGHFVAFLLAQLNVQARELVFANAGQTKPLLRSSGGVRWLDSVGLHFPLGMTEGCTYQDATIQLQPGDVLILPTDGVTEAMNAQRELYGSDRLQSLLGQMNITSLSAHQIVEAAVADVRAFADGSPQHDDITIVVVKVQ